MVNGDVVMLFNELDELFEDMMFYFCYFIFYLSGERIFYNNLDLIGCFCNLIYSIMCKDMIYLVLEGVVFVFKDGFKVM